MQSSLQKTHCFCGGILIPIDAAKIYTSSGVICDICLRYSKESIIDTFWHCQMGKCMAHKHGFDICNICIHHCSQANSIHYQQHQTLKSLCIDNDLSTCPYFKELEPLIHINSNEQKQMDDVSIVMNNFLHLLEMHNTSEELKFISKYHSICDKTKCGSYKRYNRERDALNEKEMEIDFMDEIKDKIHCYFAHPICSNHRIERKYTQLFVDCDCKNDDDSTVGAFQLGYEFVYGYHTENRTQFGSVSDFYTHFVWVKPRYRSLKEELISNDMVRITIGQYKNEYRKAHIHHNSNYRRKNVIASTHNRDEWQFLPQHALALGIYCNFTNLQYIFSKTYRENNGKDHTYFYFLGMYLKIATKKFGTNINGKIKEFYHGVGQKLLFPDYHFIDDYYGISIKCPLSTTSSLTVATAFTNNNNGLIVQFQNVTDKYFSVSWISDYPHEKEYLFVQNQGYLPIVNIYEAQTGYEYCDILQGLNALKMWTAKGYKSFKTQCSRLNGKTLEHIDNILQRDLSCFTDYGQEMVNYFLDWNKSVHIFVSQSQDTASRMDIFGEWVQLKGYHVLLTTMYALITCDHLEVVLKYLLKDAHNKLKIKVMVRKLDHIDNLLNEIDEDVMTQIKQQVAVKIDKKQKYLEMQLKQNNS